jgi:hypothetical protein
MAVLPLAESDTEKPNHAVPAIGLYRSTAGVLDHEPLVSA